MSGRAASCRERSVCLHASERQPGATAVAREGTRVQGILTSLGQLLSPIGQLFHYVFFEPIYNILILFYQALHVVFPAGAFPLAIIFLTILIRCALIPLTRKQLRSTRKMQLLQPQLK